MLSRVLIAAAYTGALLLILLGVLPGDLPVGLGAWLYTLPAGIGAQGFTGRAFNPLYQLFLVYLVTFGILSIINLWGLARSSEDALRRSLRLIFLSTSIALTAALYSSLGSFFRLDLSTLVDERMVQLVEDGLRRLQDYDHLGEHELARLRVVIRRLESDSSRVVTFIDTGKTLSQVLVEAVGRLKPEGKEPAKSEIPAREWHPYIILHGVYVLGDPNRNIMSRLYVSQGTFNRTRRRALRAIAKALGEVEQASKCESAHEPQAQSRIRHSQVYLELLNDPTSELPPG